MTLLWIADRFGPVIQKQFQDLAFVIRCSANDEVARRFAPHFLEPFQIRFEAAGSDDESLRAEFGRLPIEKHLATFEFAVAYVQFLDLGIVEDANTESQCRGVIGIHQRLASTKEEGVRAAQVKRSLQRGLKADTVSSHPQRYLD